MANVPTNTDEYIHSDDAVYAVEEYEDALDAGPDEDDNIPVPFGPQEYLALKDFVDRCSHYFRHDWRAIRHDQFVEYIKDLINECYEIPTDNRWPYCYLTMDYEGAAEAAAEDFVVISFAGVDYYVEER